MRTSKKWIGIVTLTSALVHTTAARARASDEPLERVRTFDPLVSSLIQEGTERSVTFRQLIGRLGRSDGIVYIIAGRCRGRVNACFLHSMTSAGPNRVLRIVVNTRRKPREIISSIAHELTHALEVLGDPGIRDDLAIYNFYNREGVKRGEAFETLEAIQTEIKVRSELGRHFDDLVARNESSYDGVVSSGSGSAVDD